MLGNARLQLETQNGKREARGMSRGGGGGKGGSGRERLIKVVFDYSNKNLKNCGLNMV